VARYFQALLHDPAGVWEPEVLEDATGFIRNRMVDPWIRVPANRTLGLRVAGDDGNAVLRGFGHGVGPRAFGASGVGGQVAWGDPDSGLSFCYLTNGLDADPVRSFRRQASLSELAARCVAG
jgi:CubicO group peptidase (beta-lactamase class C family)